MLLVSSNVLLSDLVSGWEDSDRNIEVYFVDNDKF